MVKWQSPLFSDLRNQLGETVVFSSWNGSHYFRTYVDVPRGDSLAQQAVRAKLREAKRQWDFLDEYFPHNEYWNARAEGTDLSGFHLFMKYFMLSELSQESNSDTPRYRWTWTHPFDSERVDLIDVYAVSGLEGMDDTFWAERLETDIEPDGEATSDEYFSGEHYVTVGFYDPDYDSRSTRGATIFGMVSSDQETGEVTYAKP